MMESEQPGVESALYRHDGDLSTGERRFRVLIETASIAIVIVDASGTIALINHKAEELFGYTREELVGRQLEVLLPERLRTVHVSHRAGYFANPHARPMGLGLELAGRHKDGSEFPIEVGLSTVETEQETLAVSFITDITERKRAEESRRRYAERLESTHQIDRAILMADSSKDVASVALTHLRRLVNCRYLSVALFDRGGGDAVVLAASPDHESSTVRTGLQFPREAFGDLAMLARGEWHAVSSVSADRGDHGADWRRFGADVRSFLRMPLVAGEDLIGVLTLAATEADAFQSEHVEIARDVAGQLAIAIQQARLREELQSYATELEQRVVERTRETERRRRVAEGLRDIVALLNSSEPLKAILDAIVMQAGHLLDTDAMVIYRLQDDNTLVVQAAHEVPDDYVTDLRVPVGEGAVGRAVAERRPFAIDDVLLFLRNAGDLDRWDDRQRTTVIRLVSQFHAVLAVPLIVKGEIYGGVSLYYTMPRTFSVEEIDLAMTVADQAALAIENARLRAEVEKAAMAAERSRLARDLHDAVTQTLFSASLIAEVLPRIWERDEVEGQTRLEELRQLTRGALAEMRTLLLELRPATLTEAPLGELLHQLGEATMGRARVPITLSVEGDCDLPPAVQVAFYRITQEALNNIVRHAGADHVTVTMRCRAGRAELNIHDDGCGFDPGEVASDHMGLAIMRERADAVAADLSVDSVSGRGTHVSVHWPATSVEDNGFDD